MSLVICSAKEPRLMAIGNEKLWNQNLYEGQCAMVFSKVYQMSRWNWHVCIHNLSVIFSRVHATLQPALVGRSVMFDFFYDFISLTSLLLPKWSIDLKHGPCPPARDFGSCVSGLLKPKPDHTFVWPYHIMVEYWKKHLPLNDVVHTDIIREGRVCILPNSAGKKLSKHVYVRLRHFWSLR